MLIYMALQPRITSCSANVAPNPDNNVVQEYYVSATHLVVSNEYFKI